MIIYTIFGLGFYIGVALSNSDSFMEEHITWWNIIKGLIFGIPLWPAALAFILYKKYHEYYE